MSYTIHSKLVSISDVSARLGIHQTTLHRWYNAGQFVPKVRMGPARVAFLAEDVDAWIAARRG